MTKKSKYNMVYISACAVIVGVFLPLASIPLYGDISYYRIAKIESFFVIVFAATSPLLIYLKKGRLAVFSAIGVWFVLLMPIMQRLLKKKEKSILGEITQAATDPLREFAANLFLNITHFRWGGYVFFIGCILFAVSCVKLSGRGK